MLLHRPPRGGLISKSKLAERFDKFARGEWVQLIHASVQCDEQAAVIRRRKGRRGDDLERRAIRALHFVQVGELSSARQALEGAEVAPGTEDTLKKLSDTSKRPDQVVGPHSSGGLGACPSNAIHFGSTHLLEESEVGETRHCRRTFRHDCGTSPSAVGQPRRPLSVAHIGRGFGPGSGA